MIIIEVYKLENKLTLPFTIKIMKRMILLHREFLTTKPLLDNICKEANKTKRLFLFAKKQIKRSDQKTRNYNKKKGSQNGYLFKFN